LILFPDGRRRAAHGQNDGCQAQPPHEDHWTPGRGSGVHTTTSPSGGLVP
jgi:hypothetical protein